MKRLSKLLAFPMLACTVFSAPALARTRSVKCADEKRLVLTETFITDVRADRSREKDIITFRKDGATRELPREKIWIDVEKSVRLDYQTSRSLNICNGSTTTSDWLDTRELWKISVDQADRLALEKIGFSLPLLLEVRCTYYTDDERPCS